MFGSLPVRGSSGASRDHARMWFDAWRVPALQRPLAVGRSVRLVGRVPESRVWLQTLLGIDIADTVELVHESHPHGFGTPVIVEATVDSLEAVFCRFARNGEPVPGFNVHKAVRRMPTNAPRARSNLKLSGYVVDLAPARQGAARAVKPVGVDRCAVYEVAGRDSSMTAGAARCQRDVAVRRTVDGTKFPVCDRHRRARWTLFVDNGWLTAIDFHAHESPRTYAMGKSK